MIFVNSSFQLSLPPTTALTFTFLLQDKQAKEPASSTPDLPTLLDPDLSCSCQAINAMHFLTQVLFSTASAIFVVGWARAEEPSHRSFVDFCAYKGVNLTDIHWLGAYCRNDMTEVFGYNYTWRVPSEAACNFPPLEC